MGQDTWDPKQYERFRAERSQPFYDLLSLLKPTVSPRVIDLGCGTGELTRLLHEQTQARETLGIDSSSAMLAQAGEWVTETLSFQQGEIATFDEAGWDIVFSNAALQWTPDHPALFTRLSKLVAPDGQLAVQMPANDDHASHRIANAVAAQEPFRSALAGYQRPRSVLSPEAYAEMLNELGFVEQHVRLQVYGHLLEASAAVVEWVKGTLLTDFKRRMSAELYERFLATYRVRLLAVLPDARPYFYAFKRMLLWGWRG
jgi:trans-aconitate 2-methyltransferase